MSLRNEIKKVLLEFKEATTETYDYGCVMLFYDIPVWNHITDMIDHDDLYEPDSNKYGVETEPHITLLYGLHSDDIEDNELLDNLLGMGIPEITMSNITLFNNKEFDVVKFDVEGDGLHNMNKFLVDNYPYTSDYPDYHPHSTIAYVKPGLGEKYVKNFSKPFVFKPNKLVYSKPDGSKITKNIYVE